MWTTRFGVDAAERAIKTAAQTALAYIGTVVAVEDLAAGWDTALLSVGIATLASLLFSIASSQVGSPTDASLVNDASPDGGVSK
jgi:hypothetical protein